MLRFHLFSACHIVLQMKNTTRLSLPVAMKNMGDKPTQPQGSHITLTQIDILCCQQKN